MIDAATTADVPADRPTRASRVWRIVALVAAFHVLIGVIGILFFSAMGLASDGMGSCGGG